MNDLDLDLDPIRIAVALRPRLLADSLARLLAEAGIEVTVVVEPSGTTRYDLAIVSDDAARVSADVTIEVEDNPDGASASVCVTGTGPVASFADLASLLRFVRHYASSRSHLLRLEEGEGQDESSASA